VFAFMIEILYSPVFRCNPEVSDGTVGDCDEILHMEDGVCPDCYDYWNLVADDMRSQSFDVFYGFLGIIFSTLIGFALMFWGFGKASERMNKRVRDAAFTSLLRQEVAWFDVRSPGALTSRLSDDAALLHAFSGEPIRSLVLSLSSVLVGVIVSFVFMWYVRSSVELRFVAYFCSSCLIIAFLSICRPFSLLTLAIMPFMVRAMLCLLVISVRVELRSLTFD